MTKMTNENQEAPSSVKQVLQKKQLLIATGCIVIALIAIPVIDAFFAPSTKKASHPTTGKISQIVPEPSIETVQRHTTEAPYAVTINPSDKVAPITSHTTSTPQSAVAATKESTSAVPPPSPAHPAPINTAPATTNKAMSEKPALAPSIPPKAAPPTPQTKPAPSAPPSILATIPSHTGKSLGYQVQLGLFSNLENAEKLVNTLKKNGIKSQTTTRVHIGPFRTRAEAEEVMNKLRQLGYQPLLTVPGQ